MSTAFGEVAVTAQPTAGPLSAEGTHIGACMAIERDSEPAVRASAMHGHICTEGASLPSTPASGSLFVVGLAPLMHHRDQEEWEAADGVAEADTFKEKTPPRRPHNASVACTPSHVANGGLCDMYRDGIRSSSWSCSRRKGDGDQVLCPTHVRNITRTSSESLLQHPERVFRLSKCVVDLSATSSNTRTWDRIRGLDDLSSSFGPLATTISFVSTNATAAGTATFVSAATATCPASPRGELGTRHMDVNCACSGAVQEGTVVGLASSSATSAVTKEQAQPSDSCSLTKATTPASTASGPESHANSNPTAHSAVHLAGNLANPVAIPPSGPKFLHKCIFSASAAAHVTEQVEDKSFESAANSLGGDLKPWVVTRSAQGMAEAPRTPDTAHSNCPTASDIAEDATDDCDGDESAYTSYTQIADLFRRSTANLSMTDMLSVDSSCAGPCVCRSPRTTLSHGVSEFCQHQQPIETGTLRDDFPAAGAVEATAAQAESDSSSGAAAESCIRCRVLGANAEGEAEKSRNALLNHGECPMMSTASEVQLSRETRHWSFVAASPTALSDGAVTPANVMTSQLPSPIHGISACDVWLPARRGRPRPEATLEHRRFATWPLREQHPRLACVWCGMGHSRGGSLCVESPSSCIFRVLPGDAGDLVVGSAAAAPEDGAEAPAQSSPIFQSSSPCLAPRGQLGRRSDIAATSPLSPEFPLCAQEVSPLMGSCVRASGSLPFPGSLAVNVPLAPMVSSSTTTVSSAATHPSGSPAFALSTHNPQLQGTGSSTLCHTNCMNPMCLSTLSCSAGLNASSASERTIVDRGPSAELCSTSPATSLEQSLSLNACGAELPVSCGIASSTSPMRNPYEIERGKAAVVRRTATKPFFPHELPAGANARLSTAQNAQDSANPPASAVPPRSTGRCVLPHDGLSQYREAVSYVKRMGYGKTTKELLAEKATGWTDEECSGDDDLVTGAHVACTAV